MTDAADTFRLGLDPADRPQHGMTEDELRAALTPDLTNVLDYLRAYEQHEGEMPAHREIENRGHAGGFLGLEVRGYVRRDEADRAKLTPKGVQAVCALETLDMAGRGLLRCPEDGELQWIDRTSMVEEHRDPTVVCHLACGHVAL